jgi:hypothetical protein
LRWQAAAMIAQSDMLDPKVGEVARRPNSWVMIRTLTNGSGSEIALWV